MSFLFEKKSFCVSFGHWADTFWCSRAGVSQQVSQNRILGKIKKTREKIIWKTFFNHCLILCKNCSAFNQKDSNGFVKLHSTSTKETWLINSIICTFFNIQSGKFSIFRRNVLGRFVKIAIYVSIEKTGKEKFDWSFFITFGAWAMIFRSSGKTLQQICRNCIIRVHRNILRGKFFIIF